MKTFTTWEAAKIMNEKVPRLREWQVFVPPSVRASGVGTKAGYTADDLRATGAFRSLIETGFKREDAAKLVAASREYWSQGKLSQGGWLIFFLGGKSSSSVALAPYQDDNKAPAVILTDGKVVEIVLSRYVVPLHQPGTWETIVVVNLATMGKQIDDRIGALGL
jgi:hypothetical protein